MILIRFFGRRERFFPGEVPVRGHHVRVFLRKEGCVEKRDIYSLSPSGPASVSLREGNVATFRDRVADDPVSTRASGQ